MADIPDKWQSGDKHAFEILFRQHNTRVLKTAYLITGNKEEAEDVLQEVFVSVWKSRNTFDPAKAKFTTWLHRITVNQCARIHRKKQHKSQSLEKTMMEEGLTLPEANDFKLPELSSIESSRYEELMDALGQLDSKHRSVMVLRYFNDLSYDEIATSLNIPLGTVKSRINKALKAMRKATEHSLGKDNHEREKR